ncbi:LamG domain-containing protein [Pyxidicoccus fallax]|uniref:LamG domain-containing protein n=1 Tax=Pyxidicoccus fallax TaxID=394095 RepID=A0A848LF74_9BACT|nr:LamG domain-containing protein [Pyxidicoccus fallax]NMO15613.1 LamG domain-containing protein [Pyxidicoccus fallax]NPC77210.1 LamG domain-containing protein [Pyxidicoccus fallax]
MARAFDITTTSPSLRLDGNRKGEVAFTVTNSLGRPVRGRAVVVPEGATPPEWLSLAGDAERDFPPNGTHVFLVQVAIPPSRGAGEHAFHLLVADQANPDEHFADGPSVAFKVPAPVAPPMKRFPWWIPVSAGAVLLIALVTGLLLRRGGQEEPPGTGGSGPVVEQPPADPPPKAQVLTFNGTTSFVDLGEPLALEITGPITMEAWIRPTNPNSVQNIIARGFVSNPGGEIFLRIVFRNYQVGSSMDGKPFGITSSSMPAQDLNNWVHVAGTFDGSQWRLYRNGELLSESQPLTEGGAYPIRARWAVGARGGGAERGFNGNIRDVRIWSVARTQDQIREGMDNPPEENEDGLLAWWPMNEGKGQRVSDRSGNEAHGFARNTQWGPSDAPPAPAADAGTPVPGR